VKTLRYGFRAGVGLLVMTSMFAVPTVASHAGESPDFNVGVNDASPDGPDPVTVDFDVSYDVRVKNNSGTAETPQIHAFTDGQRFVSYYSKDAWNCFDNSSTGPILRTPLPNTSDVLCDGPVMPAGDVSHLHLVVKAPSETGEFLGVDATETSTDSEDQELTTAQNDQNGDDATGFLPPDGGKISTDGKPTPEDPTNSSIKTFFGSGPGGVFDLHDLAPGDPGYEDICGNGNCDGKVVRVDIPRGYNDEQNPPKLKIVYDETAAGAGEDATIWIKKEGHDPQIVPPCNVNGIANPHPCHGPAHVKRNGDVRYIVYLLSGDPLCGKH